MEEHTADASAVTDIGAVREYEECAWSRARSTRARIQDQDAATSFSYCIIPFVLDRPEQKAEDVLAEVRGLRKKAFRR